MFLYLKEGEVKVTEEGMCHSVVKALYNRDKRSASKPYFYKCMTYIYWAYYTEGEYRNKPIKKRKELSAEHAKSKWTELEDDKYLMDVIDFYIDIQTTKSERLLIGIGNDIDELLELIKKIPFTKEIKIEVDIDIPLHAETSEVTRKRITTTVEHSNSEEKFKAISMSDKLIDYEDKLKKKVMKEVNRKKGGQKRMFE